MRERRLPQTKMPSMHCIGCCTDTSSVGLEVKSCGLIEMIAQPFDQSTDPFIHLAVRREEDLNATVRALFQTLTQGHRPRQFGPSVSWKGNCTDL